MSLEEKVEAHRHTEKRPGENIVKKYHLQAMEKDLIGN